MSVGKNIGIALSVILTVFWLFPYIYVVCCSFKKGSEVIAVPPKFFPKVFSIENFQGLFERMDAAQYFVNSLSAAVISDCPDFRLSCGLCDSEVRSKIVGVPCGTGAVFENDTHFQYCSSYL